MYRDRRARCGGCALPPDGPAASGCGRDRRARCGGCALSPDGAAGAGRERPPSCATLARFAGEGALRPRSTAAGAVGMLWSAGGIGRGVGTVPCAPGSAAAFAAEVAVSGAVADRLALTGVPPPQASRPDGGAGSAAPAEVPAPPIPRAGSSADRAAGASPQPPSRVSLPKDRAGCSADSAAGAGVLPPALVPSGAGGTPGCSCAPRFAGEVAPLAGPVLAPAAPAPGACACLARHPPPRPRRGRPGS